MRRWLSNVLHLGLKEFASLASDTPPSNSAVISRLARSSISTSWPGKIAV